MTALAIVLNAAIAGAQLRPQPPEWTMPHDPVRNFGNTYYVGTYDA